MRERLKATLAKEREFFGGIGAKGGFGETDAPPPPPSSGGPEPEDALTQRIRARHARRGGEVHSGRHAPTWRAWLPVRGVISGQSLRASLASSEGVN
eukprot:scaffold53814_cov50-Phaeocystis_antarctica.AAC.2